MEDSVDGKIYILGQDNKYYDYINEYHLPTKNNLLYIKNNKGEYVKWKRITDYEKEKEGQQNPPPSAYDDLPIYFHGDNGVYYTYTQDNLLNYLNGIDKYLYKYIKGGNKLLFFFSTSDNKTHRYSFQAIREHPTTDYNLYFSLTNNYENLAKCGKVASFDQLNHIPPPPRSPAPVLPPAPSPSLSQIYSNQLDVCVIKNACYLLLMKILNEKPLLSSKITSLINDLKNDFDKNCLILSELTNTYNLCKSEIKINQSVWIIDDDENGIIKEKLNEEEYLIKCNNGEEKKKKKSEIIPNSLN